MNKNKEIVELRKQGKSYQQIADLYGITKQRAHQIVKNYPMKRKCECVYKGLAVFIENNGMPRKELCDFLEMDAVTVRKLLKGQAIFIRIEKMIQLEEDSGMSAKELFTRKGAE